MGVSTKTEVSILRLLEKMRNPELRLQNLGCKILHPGLEPYGSKRVQLGNTFLINF